MSTLLEPWLDCACAAADAGVLSHLLRRHFTFSLGGVSQKREPVPLSFGRGARLYDKVALVIFPNLYRMSSSNIAFGWSPFDGSDLDNYIDLARICIRRTCCRP